MGGKNKQRTKGNVRPSSSGRAAELLAKESGTVPGFIGFGSSQSDLGYVPAVQGAEEVDSLVDADFRMVLRKLSKRDVTTKLKAMQEFGAMCKEREMETVRGVLTYWPRNYCKISLDHDRRVREATQQAFEQLILKVKKYLAPHLKSLMGFWLIAQCDTYSPAASAARAAFEAAFPAHKQPGALAFCKDEILMVLLDHLLKETPDSLSDPQTVPAEEREAKYFRVVTCSMLALKRLLSMLPSDESSSLHDRLTYLLSQNAFWKYSKHKCPNIRSAFFELISALCRSHPALINAEASRVCPSVLLSIDDSDAVVCPALWESVLYTVTTIENCWDHVNLKKGVLPKLWAVLREGGRGLATVIFPNLLPFISRIPHDGTSSRLNFYNTLFESLIQGLSSERAIVSPMEYSAVLTAYTESLRLAMQESMGEEEEHGKFRQMLLTDQLIPLLDTSLKDPKLQSSTLFSQVEETVHSWEKKAESPATESGLSKTYTTVLSIFWEGLEQVCVRHVDLIEAEDRELDGVSGLLQVMKNPNVSLKTCKKKVVKIRFTDEEDSKDDGVDNRPFDSRLSSVVSTKENEWPLSDVRQERLQDLVCKLAELSMVYITEQKSHRHLRFLASLLSAFSSVKVFQVLLEQRVQGGSKSEQVMDAAVEPANPAVRFLYQKLTAWLQEGRPEDVEFLVDVLYSVLHCCEQPSERKLLLNNLTKMEFQWRVFLYIIQKACSDPVKHSLIADWLKGDVLGNKLISLASDLCTSGLTDKATPPGSYCSDKWSLLSLVLSEHVQSESLIAEIYVEKIIDRLHCALSKARDLSEAGHVEQSVSFICDVASNFFSSVKGCLQMPSAEELLLTVFQLCAQPPGNTRLSEPQMLKLQHTWMTGLNSLVLRIPEHPQGGGFLTRSAEWIKDQIQASRLSVQSLQSLITAVNTLHDKILESGPSASNVLAQHMTLMAPSDEAWQEMRQSLPGQWWSRPLLEGRLSLNSGTSGTDLKSFSKSWLPRYLCATAVLSKTASRMLESGTLVKDEEIGMKINIVVAELLYSLQWCEELERPPPVITECCDMLRAMGITPEIVKELGDHFPALLKLVHTRSLESGALWSLTLRKLLSLRNPGHEELKQLTGSTDSYFPMTQGNLHTIQSLCPFLCKEEKESLIIQCTAQLMSCDAASAPCIDGGFGYLAVINSCLDSESLPSPEVLPGILKLILQWKVDQDGLFLFSK